MAATVEASLPTARLVVAMADIYSDSRLATSTALKFALLSAYRSVVEKHDSFRGAGQGLQIPRHEDATSVL